MKRFAQGFGGCLLWLAFLALVGLGLGIMIVNKEDPLRLLGPATVVVAGVGVIISARWRWFNDALRFVSILTLHEPSDRREDADYHAKTGVHPVPVVFGALIVLIGVGLFVSEQF